MKPASFSYLAPESVEEAAALLAEHGGSAKVLAGGQSLVPLMNFRLATPSVLVDLNRVSGLDGIAISDDRLVLGSMLRQSAAERSAEVARACPLLHASIPYIAHTTIRNRGTVGGSVAHSDPAAELPAVVLALDAQLEATSVRGSRTIGAQDFFRGYFTTALADDEILTALHFPLRKGHVSWTEFAPRSGDFALVGVATVLEVEPDGTVRDCRLACCGIADRPVRLRGAESSLLGRVPTSDAVAETAAAAAREVDPVSDNVAGADYRRHLVSVLVGRGVQAALAARGAHD